MVSKKGHLLYPNVVETIAGSVSHPETRVCVIYDPKKGNEASSEHPCIRLGNKFFALTPKEQNWVLVHELGHDLDDKRTLAQDYENIYLNPALEGEVYQYDTGKGIGNPLEIFAETFAVYNHDAKELRGRYPNIYDIHSKLARRYKNQYDLARNIAKGKIKLQRAS